MMKVVIPGYGDFFFRHLVLDYNGTIACDGELIEGIGEMLVTLSAELEIHVVTADTHGSAASKLEGLPSKFHRIDNKDQEEKKKQYISDLGCETVIAVGNGKNDTAMLREAALGVAVMQEEGCCASALLAADMVCRDIRSALNLLIKPTRLIAGLRK